MEKLIKPQPVPDGDSYRFWEGCKEEKLLIQKCNGCSKHIFYPRIICPHCSSEQIEWVESSGKGKVYSFTIARRGGGPAFKDDAPYAVALIELEEGVRMMSNIINVDVNNIQCDQQVEVVFVNEGEFTLPKFQPIS
ncbi:Zn-ribbon domain-containing OB-fold protein [Cytobacillus purgationiresistens]|uniref:OB-fold protein n=1 Tax=Cytobacillus purgationiresistens TaxID=863449 RepID=A0ABU0AFN5_9BACI|nr:Zn-ribbon domain-containing OB-fold protein [Cytobacillus purgationiresistens]MDQ0269674.1 putative OB-fold protein [Cytobacillus purgationiresistens]